MEFIIIPQLILIFSLFGVLFILGRNFSGFKEVSKIPLTPFDKGGNLIPFDKGGSSERGIIQEEEEFMYLCRRLAKRINFRTAQEKHRRLSGAAHIKLEKILRKTRIGFLKLDNKFMAWIEKLRKRKEKQVQEKEVDKSASGLHKPAEEEPTPDPSPQKNGARQEGNNQAEDKKIPLAPFDKGGKFEEGNDHSEDKPPPAPSFVRRGVKEEEYLEAISGDPKNADAYWKLGILYSRRRNYKDALNCFKEIVKIKPGYEKAKEKVKIISEKIRK